MSTPSHETSPEAPNDTRRRKLTAREQATLRRLYDRQRERTDRADVAYVLDKGIDRALELGHARERWLVDLGSRVHLLHDVLLDWSRGDFECRWKSVAAITAALHYFTSPWDLIPDVFPVARHRDDEAVVNACIELVASDLRRYGRANGLDLSDAGV